MRISAGPVCVVCRDELGAGAQTCLGCGALYHGDCLEGLRGRCATLGCREPRPAPMASGRPGRLVLSSAQVTAAAAARSRPRPAGGSRTQGGSTIQGCLGLLAGAAVFVLIVAGGGAGWFEIAVYLAFPAGGLAYYAAQALSEALNLEGLLLLMPPAPVSPTGPEPSLPTASPEPGPTVRVRPRPD